MNFIEYINFWHNFNPKKIWIHDCIKPATKKNITVSSVFLNKTDIQSLLSKKSNNHLIILYSFENLYKNNYSWLLKYFEYFDLILGINDIICNNYIRVPHHIMNNNLNNSGVSNKNKNICMVSKNPHKLRLKIIHELTKKNIGVDSGGPVLNNIGYNVESKHNFLLDYYFNICPENSYAKGYCTEKIYEALQANCIPIYWGDLSLDKNFINTQKILYINKDLSNIKDVVCRCESLLENRKELHHIIQQPSFNLESITSCKKNILKKIHQHLNRP